jgi:hypothetical protein
MTNSIFRDITPRSPLKVNRRFVGTRCLHLQGRRIREARNQREAGIKQSSAILPERRLAFNGLHGVKSQKIELFITTAVRTSNRKYMNVSSYKTL